MQTLPHTQKQPVRITIATIASAGLSLVLASVLSYIACSGGFLFGGTSVFSVAIGALIFSTIITVVTALIFKRRQKFFGWRTLFMEVALLTLVAVGVLAWIDTRQHLRIFMKPSPVPNGLRVRHGRQILFASYLHFTGSPAAIVELLKSKGLEEVPIEPPESSDFTGFSARARTKEPWDWWQPASMEKPKFYFRHHKSEAVQGWSEGWWVNEATNEVYAFIGG